LFCALNWRRVPYRDFRGSSGPGRLNGMGASGIAAAVAEGDSAEAHAADTIAVGAGLVDEAVALGLAREAGARIHDLLRYGVPSIATSKASLRSHRRPRIRATHRACARRHGRKAIISALIEAVRVTPSIRVIEGYAAEALLTEDGRSRTQLRKVGDAIAKPVTIASRAVVLATAASGISTP